MTLALEPLNTAVDHPGYFLTSSAEGFGIVDAVDSPNVKLLYDVYHQQITKGNIVQTETSRRENGCSAAAVDINLQEQLRVRVDRGVQPLLLAVNLDLFLVDRDPRRLGRRQVALCLGQLLFPVPDRLIPAIDTQLGQDSLDFTD